jgi:coatomer protein complex subunit epsilon
MSRPSLPPKRPRMVFYIFLTTTSAALLVQVYLKIDRPDLARKLLVEIRAWADDATLAQLVEAWVDVYARDGRKYQDAYYIFEELSSSKVPTPSLLNGQAVCRMQG